MQQDHYSDKKVFMFLTAVKPFKGEKFHIKQKISNLQYGKGGGCSFCSGILQEV